MPSANYYLTLVEFFFFFLLRLHTDVYILIYRLIFAFFWYFYCKVRKNQCLQRMKCILRLGVSVSVSVSVYILLFYFYFINFVSLLLLLLMLLFCSFASYYIRFAEYSVAFENRKAKQGKELVTSFLIYT